MWLKPFRLLTRVLPILCFSSLVIGSSVDKFLNMPEPPPGLAEYNFMKFDERHPLNSVDWDEKTGARCSGKPPFQAPDDAIPWPYMLTPSMERPKSEKRTELTDGKKIKKDWFDDRTGEECLRDHNAVPNFHPFLGDRDDKLTRARLVAFKSHLFPIQSYNDHGPILDWEAIWCHLGMSWVDILDGVPVLIPMTPGEREIVAMLAYQELGRDVIDIDRHCRIKNHKQLWVKFDRHGYRVVLEKDSNQIEKVKNHFQSPELGQPIPGR